MTIEPDTTHQDTPYLRNHWWWRPGWDVGTRFYTWHVTFDDAPELRRLVATYQEVLSTFSDLDLVPQQWLHLTIQGVGHVQDVPDAQRDQIVEAVRSRVAPLEPFNVAFHQPVIRPEAIILPPTPSNGLQQLRTAVRHGIAGVVGNTNVPEAANGYQPHVSLAYANASRPAEPVRAALNRINVAPARVSIDAVSLIRLHRDRRMYEWTRQAAAPAKAEL